MLRPSVYGQLVDRYIFNFHVDGAYLESQIPVDWLKPRLCHGHGVVSFCLLRLRGVTLWPFPTSLGISSISCAYRYAVTDSSGSIPEPSVYILGRSTNVPILTKLGTVLFSGEVPLVNAVMEGSKISVTDNHERPLFVARTGSSKEFASNLFDSTDDFAEFMKDGPSSYAPSTHNGRLSRIDLVEDSSAFRPIDAQIEYSRLSEEWGSSGLGFDSAFHATGGVYRLTPLGTVPAQTKAETPKIASI